MSPVRVSLSLDVVVPLSGDAYFPCIVFLSLSFCIVVFLCLCMSLCVLSYCFVLIKDSQTLFVSLGCCCGYLCCHVKTQTCLTICWLAFPWVRTHGLGLEPAVFLQNGKVSI